MELLKVLGKEVSRDMRYMIGSQMGLFAVPILVLGFVAYVWVVERLLGKKSEVAAKPEEISSVRKVA